MRRLLRSLIATAQRRRSVRPHFRPELTVLEGRVVPATVLFQSHNYAGMQSADSASGYVPPDTHLAAGPSHLVEVVNDTVAIFSKSTGAKVSSKGLKTFFSSLNVSASAVFDPVVTYDELAQRFVVAALAVNEAAKTSALLVGVSNGSDPTAGFTELQKINVKETTATGKPLWGDNHKIGWNADAYVFTMNMFNYPLETGPFDHLQVVTIKKSTVLDANTATLTKYQADRTGHFSMIPAVMHGAAAGGPMWFVETAGSNQMRVVKMTNLFSNAPTFSDTSVGVDAYKQPPSATQKGGSGKLDTGDWRSSTSSGGVAPWWRPRRSAWPATHWPTPAGTSSPPPGSSRFRTRGPSTPVPASTPGARPSPSRSTATWA